MPFAEYNPTSPQHATPESGLNFCTTPTRSKQEDDVASRQPTQLKFLTRAIHAGNAPDKETGALGPPLYLTSTYAQNSPGQPVSSYDYTRAGNPSFTRLEEQIASLESAKHGVVMTSGLSIITSLLTHVRCTRGSDKVVVGAISSLYGGTYRLLSSVFSKMGVEVLYAKAGDWAGIEELLASKTEGRRVSMFIFETPTNPLLEIIDIERVVSLRDSLNPECIIAVDNTFATPYHQSPLAAGADVAFHSSTKYLGGHSDVLGGAVVTNNKEIADAMIFHRLAMGFNPSPFDCWLIGRSLKTLGLRMKQHSTNALLLATWLAEHPKVRRVIYPGLPSHENHELAKKQMVNGFGGMLSVEFNLSLEETRTLISGPFKVFTLAESLGAVESLINHPASMTHASIPADVRKEIGLSDSLVRISVGVEDISDMIDELGSLLDKM